MGRGSIERGRFPWGEEKHLFGGAGIETQLPAEFFRTLVVRGDYQEKVRDLCQQPGHDIGGRRTLESGKSNMARAGRKGGGCLLYEGAYLWGHEGICRIFQEYMPTKHNRKSSDRPEVRASDKLLKNRLFKSSQIVAPAASPAEA